jgi:hypothetical protein
VLHHFGTGLPFVWDLGQKNELFWRKKMIWNRK